MKKQLFLSYSLISSLVLFGQSLEPDVISSSGDYFKIQSGSITWTLGEIATETYNSGNIILTQGFQQTWQESGYSLMIKVWLEGPFSGNVMTTDLNGLGDFPLNQPYSDPPWNYTGTESILFIPNPNIVDWILLELRDASEAGLAGANTTIDKQAAFILNDGTIVGMDGYSLPVFNGLISNNLFVAIWHRNHLGVLSNFPLQSAGNIYNYDFTTGVDQVYGGFLGHKEIAAGIWGLVGGDGDGQGQINNTDKNEVWTPQAGTSGYLAGDFSMDGQVNNLDKNDIWALNSGKGTQVPDYTPPGGFRCMIP